MKLLQESRKASKTSEIQNRKRKSMILSIKNKLFARMLAPLFFQVPEKQCLTEKL